MLQHETMSINRNWVVKITPRLSKSLQLMHLDNLLFHPPSSYRIIKEGHEALNFIRVFKVPEPNQLFKSIVRIMWASVL